MTRKQIGQIAIMYNALKQIAKEYQTPKQLRHDSEKDWGVGFEEALEMSYENIQQTASQAIKGVNIKSILESGIKNTI